MKRKSMIGLLVVALSVSAGVLIYKRKHLVAGMNANTTWVRVTKVSEVILPSEVHAIGNLTARSIDITPEIAGHVNQIYFQDGVSVKQGDLLIQLDDAIYKAQNEAAAAKLKLSELNFDRVAQLGKKGMISKQAIDQADADLKERQAEANQTAAMLSKTQLTAPFDGVVGKFNVSVGEYVGVNQKLVSLTDISHYRIEYHLPEKYISSIALEQAVTITTASYPGKSFIGKVSFISPTINTDSRTIFLYADIPNDSRQLAAGMFVNVMHSLGADEKALMVPERSLVPMLDGQQVYKVVNGKAYAITAQIGRHNGGNVQITKGLAPGDVVVTDGQMKLTNGMAVRIKV